MGKKMLETIKEALQKASQELKVAKSGTDWVGDKEGSRDIEEVIKHTEKVKKKFLRKM